MKLIREKTYYLFFEAGLVIKAAISAVEILLGSILYLIPPEKLSQFFLFLVGNEMQEVPRDPLWDVAAKVVGDFAKTPIPVWAFLFISHGVVKIIPAVGLLKNKLWAYPISIIIYSALLAYQIYQLFSTPSFIMWAITIFDIALIALIWHEYRRKKRKIVELLSVA
jgi:uncharacterized membrane protein